MTDFQARLLAAAIRAPSGDNCQPWCFRLKEPLSITIRANRHRARSFFDYQQSATALSIGAVIENMRQFACSEGFSTKVSYGSEDDEPISAKLEFSDDGLSQVPSRRIAALFERTVNRRPFLPIPISSNHLKRLLENPVEGTDVHAISQRSTIAKWAQVIELADRIRYSHREIHEELFSKLLFTAKIADETRIGLEIDRLGLGPLGGRLLQWLRPWDRVQRLSRWGLVQILARQSGLLARAAGMLVLVTIRKGTSDNWMQAGEQVQRLWIVAHELGLQTHPMPVALYLDQRYQQEGSKHFHLTHQVLLEQLRQKLADLIQDGIGTMIFRLGHGWAMKGQSVRLRMAQFVEEIPSSGEPKEGIK